MAYLCAALLIVVLPILWLSNFLGLPGNWFIVAAAGLYAWLMPTDVRVAIGWPVVGVVASLAVLGEVVELAASAAGVRKVGGSRRGAVLALFGSVADAIAGLFVGIPVPVVGSLLAAFLFAGLGALAGAMLGEMWKGR